jgi:hypothetical protein
MNLTGQQVINNALTILGLLEQGGTPSVSDSNDSLSDLNSAWDAWSVDEDMIYAVIALRFPWAAAIAFYTIGAGAQFNTQAPARIYQARWITATGGAISSEQIDQAGLGYVVGDTGIIPGGVGTIATYTVNTVGSNGQVETLTISVAGNGYRPGYGYQTQTGGGQPGAGTGLTIDILTVSAGGQNRNPLDVVASEEYYSHRDLSTTGQVPDELYPDYNPDASGFAKLHAWPIPNTAGTIEIDAGVAFQAWTLTGSYNLPAAWADTLQWALAWRLLPRFGAAVAQQVAEVVREIGAKAEARLIAANRFNRRKPPAPGPAMNAGGSPISAPAASAIQGLEPGK